MRARLERAGLVVVPTTWDGAVASGEELAQARGEAASGTSLAALISDDRR